MDPQPVVGRGPGTAPPVPWDLRVLGPVELVLFKALFDRPKDWVDIATVVDAGAVDRGHVRDGLIALLGNDDPRVERWDALTS